MSSDAVRFSGGLVSGGPATGGPVLGIVDGLHDAGAALVSQGRILAAANEERFTRRKLQGGWPKRSIASVLETAGIEMDAVRAVAVGGFATPTLATRIARPVQRMYARSLGICFDRPWHPVDRIGDLVRYRLRLTRRRQTHPTSTLRFVLRRALPKALRDKPLHIYDHHHCHAASAAHTAGEGRWLVVTADAHGDGRSWTVHERTETGGLIDHQSVGVNESLGAFYSYVTCTLGFRPGRHEGKVLGLAARGDSTAVVRPFPFRWDEEYLRYDGRWGLRGMRDLRALKKLPREHVAAWLQTGTQHIVLEGVRRQLQKTELRSVALAGGLFANVSINGALARLPEVDALHVFPHMGDGGLAAGAALLHDYRDPGTERVLLDEPMSDAALGPQFTEQEAQRAIESAGLDALRPEDPDQELVAALCAGNAVARVVGRMEFGPRALGQRSVLAPANRTEITALLNAALHRDDFMPFGPIVAAEKAATSFEGVAACAQALRFMTVALQAKPYFQSACPAAVHVDGSARPQIVVRSESPELHRLVTQYGAQSGQPGLINTSFNRHEEPLVNTPREAVAAFVQARLACMRLGPFIVRHPNPRAWSQA